MSTRSQSQRVEAAAQAYNHASTGSDDWNDSDRWTAEDRTIRLGEMSHALDAADAVMFSDEAMERAAKALFKAQTFNEWESLDPKIKPLWINKVRAVIAAIKEDA